MLGIPSARRPVPPNLDWDTWLGTAPKKPFDPYTFARWRCWREYGTGLAGDLLVHMVSGIMFALGINEPPKRAMAMGGILRWKDGRNMPDVHASLFDWANLPISTYLNLGSESPETVRFMGSKGYMDVGESSLTYVPQPGIDLAPSYYAYGFPHAMREAYFRKWHEENDPKPGQEPLADSVTYKGISYDDVKPHLWKFFQSVRSRQPAVEDAVFGNHAALACHMANESYFRKSAVYLDAATRTIKS